MRIFEEVSRLVREIYKECMGLGSLALLYLAYSSKWRRKPSLQLLTVKLMKCLPPSLSSLSLKTSFTHCLKRLPGYKRKKKVNGKYKLKVSEHRNKQCANVNMDMLILPMYLRCFPFVVHNFDKIKIPVHIHHRHH